MSEVRSVTEAAGDLRGPFYDALAEGLHAMAQPLTILQSCVLIAAKPELAKMATPEMLGDMAGEVERMCGLFRCLQDLVQANGGDGERSLVNLGDLARSAIETVGSRLRAAGVSAEVSGLESLPGMWMDEVRVKQGWTSLLEAALLTSSPGGALRISGEFERDSVAVWIEGDGGRREAGSVLRLKVTVAKALLEAAGAEVTSTVDPFHVRILFTPAA